MAKVIDIEKILSSPESKEYCKYSREVGKCFKTNQLESSALNRRYNKALGQYREYLSQKGVLFPVPKYPIIKGKKETLRYCSTVVRELADGSMEYVCMVKNKKWIYEQVYKKESLNVLR